MGSKKKVYVSSQVWNLAGALKDRADFKKVTVIGGVLEDAVTELGNHIATTYRTGPYMRYRSYARWCVRKGFNDYANLQISDLEISGLSDAGIVNNHLGSIEGVGPTKSLQINALEAGRGRLEWFLEEYLVAHYGNDVAAGFDLLDPPDLDNPNLFKVRLTRTNQVVTFSLVLPDISGKYLFVNYSTSEVKPNGEIDNLSGSGAPDISKYNLVSDTGIVNVPVTLVTTTYAYYYNDDGVYVGSDSWTSSSTGYKQVRERYYAGKKGRYVHHIDDATGQPVYAEDKLYWKTDSQIETKWEYEYTESVDYEYHIEYLTHNHHTWTSHKDTFLGGTPDELKVFIYPLGSGNTDLDSFIESSSSPVPFDGFTPALPIVIDKKKATGERADWNKKAFKKATSGKISKLYKSIDKEAEALEAVNHIYAVYGVTLNTRSKYCRRYIYDFFRKLDPNTASGISTLADFKAKWDAAEASVIAYNQWASTYSGSWYPSGPDDVIPNPPMVLNYPKPPIKSFFIKSNPSLSFEISWLEILYESGTGLGKPGARKDDIWYEYLDDINLEQQRKMDDDLFFGSIGGVDLERFELYCQEDKNKWGKLIFTGLVHKNYVYGSKAVEITAKEAFDENQDNEEGTGESAFLVPLSAALLKEIGIIKGTQIVTEGHYLVFNSYKIVKKKWYSSGIFQIVVIVAYVAFSVATAGAGAAAAPGIFGTTAAVTGALTAAGVAASTALIVGSIANALVAAILSAIITKVSTKLFGAKLGALIGAIASIALIGGFNGSTTFNPANMFSEFMKSDNLLKLTNSVVEGYTTSKLQGMQSQMDALMKDYKQQSAEMARMYEQTFGAGRGSSLMAVNYALAQNAKNESPQDFLERTLMTGSDIAALTHAQISNYVAMNTSLDLP